jgi:hypothetical protein
LVEDRRKYEHPHILVYLESYCIQDYSDLPLIEIWLLKPKEVISGFLLLYFIFYFVSFQQNKNKNELIELLRVRIFPDHTSN